jgi:two-component system response regulator MprA
VLARLRALLRRTREEDTTALLRIADLSMDPTGPPSRGAAIARWSSPRPSSTSWNSSVRNAGVVLDQTTIYETHLGIRLRSRFRRILRCIIRYLRLKTEDAGEPRLIHTVRGVGYVVREL